MLTHDMIPHLLCPTCQSGEMSAEVQREDGQQVLAGTLRCSSCGEAYPVAGGVPALMPAGVLDRQEWREWQRHLDKFQARREDRVAKPNRVVTRLGRRARPQAAFARFTGIGTGRVLDVGCGPGKFRFNFDPDRIEYFGLDPITLLGTEEFRFVRALAERIPFRAGTFSDIFVLAALDHFRDVPAFCSEAARVLRPDGRLHVLQSVHEIRGPVSLVKVLGHRLKDSIEDRVMDAGEIDAPKHLAEYTSASLEEAFAPHFRVDHSKAHSTKWYSPTNLFLSLAPRESVAVHSTNH